jgi:group I intron endonuclease
MVKCGIYKIQSIIKPKQFYIGSAINFNNRKDSHLCFLRKNKHHSEKLQNHFNKYGESDLRFEFLIGCNEKDLICIEQFFIDSLNPYFNICKIAGNTLGFKHSEESKQKMRKPKNISNEVREKMKEIKLGNTNGFKKGQKHSGNNIWKIGIPLAKEHKQNISNSLMGNIPWNKGIKQKDYRLININNVG